MKKIIIVVLVLAILCTALCGCDVRDGMISDNNASNGTVNGGAGGKNDKNNSKTDKNNGNGNVQNTAVPGTQVITP